MFMVSMFTWARILSELLIFKLQEYQKKKEKNNSFCCFLFFSIFETLNKILKSIDLSCLNSVCKLDFPLLHQNQTQHTHTLLLHILIHVSLAPSQHILCLLPFSCLVFSSILRFCWKIMFKRQVHRAVVIKL